MAAQLVTERTNVTKSVPLYPGHLQPDLLVPEARRAQANLARAPGVDAFCDYHYWRRSGRRVLERPFDEVFLSGVPALPVMLYWANQTWGGVWNGLSSRVEKLHNRWLDFRKLPTVVDYASRIDTVVPRTPADDVIPCVLPNWDNTPRSGSRGLVIAGSTPELFGAQVERALDLCRRRKAADSLLFVKSWNEWAEGNHLEPCRRHGLAYLEQLRAKLAQA